MASHAFAGCLAFLVLLVPTGVGVAVDGICGGWGYIVFFVESLSVAEGMVFFPHTPLTHCSHIWYRWYH